MAVAASSIVGRPAAEFFAGRISQVVSGDWASFADGLRADTAGQELAAELEATLGLGLYKPERATAPML